MFTFCNKAYDLATTIISSYGPTAKYLWSTLPLRPPEEDNSPCPVNGPMEKLDTDKWRCSSIVDLHCTVELSNFLCYGFTGARLMLVRTKTSIFTETSNGHALMRNPQKEQSTQRVRWCLQKCHKVTAWIHSLNCTWRHIAMHCFYLYLEVAGVLCYSRGVW